MLVFACVSLLCAARQVAALCEKESSARQTDGQAVTSSEPLTAGNGGVETDVGTPAAEVDSTTGCNCSSSSCPRSPAARAQRPPARCTLRTAADLDGSDARRCRHRCCRPTEHHCTAPTAACRALL